MTDGAAAALHTSLQSSVPWIRSYCTFVACVSALVIGHGCSCAQVHAHAQARGKGAGADLSHRHRAVAFRL